MSLQFTQFLLFTGILLFPFTISGSVIHLKDPGTKPDYSNAGEVSVLISNFNDESCYKEVLQVLSKTKGVFYAEEISAVKNGEREIRILYDNSAIDEYRIKFILHNLCQNNSKKPTGKINFENKDLMVPKDISKQMNKRGNSDANSYSLPNIFSAFSGLF